MLIVSNLIMLNLFTQNNTYFEAKNINFEIDPYTLEIEITYDIINSSPYDFYLAELSYYEFFSYKIIIPVENSVYGDGGAYAFMGGENKKMIWDFKKQNLESLEMGQFVIDIHEIKKSDSRELYRLRKRQIKITSKLERENMKSGRKRRLEKRLDKKLEKINKKGSRY